MRWTGLQAACGRRVQGSNFFVSLIKILIVRQMSCFRLLNEVIIAKGSEEAVLVLTVQLRAWLKELAASRSAAARVFECATAMLA